MCIIVSMHKISDGLDGQKNGEDAGSQGYAKHVEAIQIQLVKKDGTAPGNTDNHFYKR